VKKDGWKNRIAEEKIVNKNKTTFQTAGSGKKAGTHEWYTPPYIIKALGEFDLDPCFSNPIWETAKKHIGKDEDGILQEWEGRVWCNPPYGEYAIEFVRKCSEHKNAITLLFVRTDTKMFHKYIFPKAHSIFFFDKRIQFYGKDGKVSKGSVTASCLIAWDKKNTEAIRKSGLKGRLVIL